jgi:uncharacterized protein YfaP (DUF2135 family)
MKRIFLFLLAGSLLFACDTEDDDSDGSGGGSTTLVGQDGNPRFNLQFTNADNVDLDLYVKTPNGTLVYYGNRSGQGGTLDVDCLCDNCASGPNENIYWVNGTAPTGQYEYWVNYYGDCGTNGSSSSFTLRVIKNGTVLTTKTGTLNSNGDSAHWTYSN